MATNIELNYYNGSSYNILYPYVNLSNSTGSITASQVPNISASKITSGTLSSARLPSSIDASTLNGYTYSQIISNANSDGSGVKIGDSGSYYGASTDDSVEINLKKSHSYDLFIIACPNFTPGIAANDHDSRHSYLVSFLTSNTSFTMYRSAVLLYDSLVNIYNEEGAFKFSIPTSGSGTIKYENTSVSKYAYNASYTYRWCTIIF